MFIYRNIGASLLKYESSYYVLSKLYRPTPRRLDHSADDLVK